MARPRIPEAVKGQLGGSRILGWGRWQSARDELGYAVATMAGLYLFRTPDSIDTVITWDGVIRAQWNDPILEVIHQPEPGRGPVARVLTLPEPGQVPVAVRDRVSSNIYVATHVNLVGELGARLIARRVPEGTGINWTVVFDAGLDPSDPALRSAAADELAATRAQFGV